MRSLRLAALLLLASCSVPPATSAGCTSPASARCNFVCDCWDCSDERHCGYHRDSPVLGLPFSCDFEQDDCGWKDVSTSSNRWVRERQRSPMWGTRPHADHTLGTRWGWFMATGSHGGNSAASATLRSPVLRDAAATCEIHLHYRIWSPGPSGNLSLSVQLTDNSQTIVLWESRPKPVLAWRREVIYPGRVPGEFQVTVTASQEPHTTSNVAIDDFEFRHCALSAPQTGCPEGQYHCTRGSCVEAKAVCDGTDDCGDNSDESQCEKYHFCDFENDMCGWSPPREQVNEFGPKPSRDHTTNGRSGHFLRPPPGSSLSGPPMNPTNNTSCSLVLYYMMDGSNSSSLTIEYNEVQVLEIEGQRGNVWLRERVTIPALNATYLNVTYRIVIKVHGVGEPDAVVALDDLILSPECAVAVSGNHEAIPIKNLQGPLSGGTGARINTIDTCHTGPFTFASGETAWASLSVGTQTWRKSVDQGGVLTVTSGEGNLLTPAEAQSPPICAVSPRCAINITYSFSSGPAGSLSMRVWDPESDTHTHVWWHTQESNNSWRSEVVLLGERLRPFQLVLSAFLVPASGGAWEAKVDEIQFLQCDAVAATPADSVTCNFDSGLCGWYQDRTNDLDWELRTPSDHTTGRGTFLHVAGESHMDRGVKARLTSYPQSRQTHPQCLSLYYRIWGPDAGSLNLYIKFDGEEETLLWSGAGTRGNRWHRETVALPDSTKTEYQLFLDAVRDGSVGHISIDDITLTRGACVTPKRCTFESGLCGFAADGKYKWKIQQGAHAQPHTGPFVDHTLQTLTGHYAVVDTSAGALPQKKTAVLTTGKHVAQPDPGCLSFWYLLGNSHAGTLNVYLVTKGKTRLLSISETHRGGWHYQSVEVESDREWSVTFEAVGAGGDQCFIALDDIQISSHHCHQHASCDFETGFCTWTNVRILLMDTYDWDMTSGAALKTAETDHTLGTAEGHYAFVDTGAMHTDGSTAWLISEYLPATDGSCFNFWFRTDAPDHNHLGELVLFVISSHGLQPVWFLHGYHSDDWQEAQLQINSTVEFQIVFEASKGTRPHSTIISLDDITYAANIPCKAKKEEKKKSNGGTVLAIILIVLLILVCLAVAYMLYQKRKKHQAIAQQTSIQSQVIDGFDNVMFGASTATD